MKKNNIFITGLILFISLLIMSIAGCGDAEINSQWRTKDIIIDGNDTDWGNTLIFNDKLNSLVGVTNDNDYLYICLVTTDQQLITKIFRTGLTLWFDNKGDNDKKFGIRFPLMPKNIDRNEFRQGQEGQESEQRDPEKMRETMLLNQTDIEVITGNNENTRVPIAQMKGVELKMGLKDYRMVYEMKIPLAFKEGFNYALNTKTGSTISVGLETGNLQQRRDEFQRQNRGEGEGSGGGMEPPTGEGGGDSFGGEGGMRRGGGRRGGGSNRGGGAAGETMQPLDFWAEVKLSTGSN